MNPMKMLLNNSLSAQNTFAETQLRRLHTQTLPFANMSSTASSYTPANAPAATSAPAPTTSSTQTGYASAPEANTLNIRLLLDPATASNIANMRVHSPRRVQSPQVSHPTPGTTAATVDGPVRRPETLRRTRSREYLNAGLFDGANPSPVAGFGMSPATNSSLRGLKHGDDDDGDDVEEEREREHEHEHEYDRELAVQSHGGRARAHANGIHRVMTMANRPLTASMLAALAEH
jgi:hypothetical protein